MIGGEAPRTLAAMWVMTAAVFIVLGLRLYTRIFVVKSVGADDHMYFWSALFLLFYNLFLQVSAHYGFGQDQNTLTLDDAAKAHMWELVGQTFVILGMGMSKMSLALFLLRIVVVRWHRLTIWIIGGTLCFASCLTAILCWFQCIPAARIYDKRIPGRCIIQPVPWAILLGSYCIFVDFFFAVFPWVFLYGLEMKRKEKMIVGISLSFGILAGVCGIVRTANLGGIGSPNYTGDTIKLVVWCSAEMSVTLICIAVPCLVPLYTRMPKGTSSSSSSASNSRNRPHKHSTSASGGLYEMGPAKPQAGVPQATENDERNTAVNGPFTEVRIMYATDGNNSDDAILTPSNSADRKRSGITVTEVVSVRSSSR